MTLLNTTTSSMRTTGSKKVLSRSKISIYTMRIVGVTAALLTLNGCLLTSPYWNQQFSSHTAVVPLQAWTTDKTKQVKFECAKAFHGGLYPSAGTASWVHISTVGPQQQSLKDSFGAKVYGAGKKTALPASCWRQDPGNSVWYAAVRATQASTSGTVSYQNFNKAGLECLGQKNGKATSWFGWIGKGCVATYSGSTTPIPYVIFRAPS